MEKLRGIIVGGEVEDCRHQEVKELGGEVCMKSWGV